MRPRIVGIVGGTASGKSTLAAELIRIAGANRAVCLPLDAYYRCLGHLTPEERARQNMDHPDTLDHCLYANHLETLLRGDAIEAPVYDFKTHTRVASVERVQPMPFVIAEGILVLHYPEVRGLCDYSIFLDVPEQERLARRISRDIRERGRTETSVIEQWGSHVQPMHAAFCEPSKVYATEILFGHLRDADTSDIWVRIERACGA